MSPAGLALDRAGNLLIASWNHCVWKLNRARSARIVAGDGLGIFGGDGGPASKAHLCAPSGIAFDPEGRLVIADSDNHRIRRVDASGRIATIAGTGEHGWLMTASGRIAGLGEGVDAVGDGRIAGSARLSGPRGIAFDPEGHLFIADYWNRRIRKVDGSGVVTTVAGTGKEGFSGEGGPAAQAMIREPFDIAFDPAGNLYFSDRFNHRICKVDKRGLLSTVVGTGVKGFAGDGGRATEARLAFPSGLCFDPRGQLFFCDTENHRVRMVNREGIVTTVAGNGGAGFSGNGGSANRACLNSPWGIVADHDGGIYISDFLNDRIYQVSRAGIITTTVSATGRFEP